MLCYSARRPILLIRLLQKLMLSVSTQTSIALTKDPSSSKVDSCTAASHSLKKRFIDVITPSFQTEICIKSIKEIKNRESCYSQRTAILPVKDIVSIKKEEAKVRTQHQGANRHNQSSSRARKLQEIVLQNQENISVSPTTRKPSFNHIRSVPETPIHRLLYESRITYRFH